MENPVEVFFQYTDKFLNTTAIRHFANKVLKEEQLSVSSLSIVFVDDEYLRNLHKEYLNDETFTDVMTFDLGDGVTIEGEIYISLERAREQAQVFGVPYVQEIARLIIHGILHLAGMNDTTAEERKKMREKEEFYLSKFAKEIGDFLLKSEEETNG